METVSTRVEERVSILTYRGRVSRGWWWEVGVGEVVVSEMAIDGGGVGGGFGVGVGGGVGVG